MTEYEGLLDELDTSESRFGTATVRRRGDGETLVVPVIALGVSGHPLHPGGDLRYVDRAYLRFDKVRAARRKVRDYDAQGRLVDTDYEIVDVPERGATVDGAESFRLEGVEGQDPGRYVLRWDILADRFLLIVPPEVRLQDRPWTMSGDAAAFLSAAPPDWVLA